MKIIQYLINEVVEWILFVLNGCPGLVGQKLRAIFYKIVLKHCGQKLLIMPSCELRGFKNIEIGDAFIGGLRCQIYAQQQGSIKIEDYVALNSSVMINANEGGTITIGSHVMIGPNTVLRSSNHNYSRQDIPIQKQGHTPGAITIEDDVWIGSNVVILPDVKISRGSIIGAGAVVTKDVPPLAIAVGVPARVINYRHG